MTQIKKPKIYLASKMKYSEMFRGFYQQFPGLTFTSRWPFLEPFIQEQTPDICNNFWEGDFDDIDSASHVILYGEPGDNLRGALIETGYAIAKGKFVHIVGDNENFGTWQYTQRAIRHGPGTPLVEVLNEIDMVAREARKMRESYEGKLFHGQPH